MFFWIFNSHLMLITSTPSLEVMFPASERLRFLTLHTTLPRISGPVVRSKTYK